MIITIANEKGGTGKTTIAINIAKALKNDGKTVLLVDADLQESARDWHEANGGESLDVVGLDRPTLDVDIRKYIDLYEYIIIDSGARLQEMTIKAIKCADVVLIPVQPSPYDVWGSSRLVDLIKERQEITNGRPRAAFVISRQKTGTKIGHEVRETIAEYGFPVLDHGTYDRTIYSASAVEGKAVDDLPTSPASTEIRLLLNDILEFAR